MIDTAATAPPQWLYGVVQWAVMIAVAFLGALLLRRRWLAHPG
jgi:hypothetical protein